MNSGTTKKEKSVVETLFSEVVLDEKKLTAFIDRIRRQGGEIDFLKNQNNDLVAMRGEIEGSLQTILTTRDTLIACVPKVGDFAQQILTILAETEERVEKSGNGIVASLAATERNAGEISERIVGNGKTFVEEITGFLDSHKSFVNELGTSFQNERWIELSRLKERMEEIVFAGTIEARRREALLTKKKNDALEEGNEPKVFARKKKSHFHTLVIFGMFLVFAAAYVATH